MSGFDSLKIEDIKNDIIKYEAELFNLMDEIRKNVKDISKKTRARQLSWILKEACQLFKKNCNEEYNFIEKKLIYLMECEEELNLIK
jgi:hypothetical protein